MRKVVTLSEEDVCSLLQKYSAAAILTVLGEIARYPKLELNWDDIARNTCSGIKSASHLQLLWRHLAYRLPLDNISNIDYDSDLDVDLQPDDDHLSLDDVSAAASCVTLLASAPSSSEFLTANVIDLDIPPLPPFPSLSQPPLSIDPNRPLRRKRKWTHDEDSKLIASVLKWGEGNWIPISDSLFPYPRSPAQLAQRWSHLRKRQGSVHLGPPTSTAPHLSEAQLATRRAINMALKDNLPPAGNGAPVSNSPVKPKPSNGESPATSISVQAKRRLPQAANTTALTTAPSSTVPKPRSGLKKAPPKPPSMSDTIQRTAVAAGARIVNPSDAKPVQSYATVRFFRTGASDSTVSMDAELPKAKTMSATSANESLQKKEENTSMKSNIPCSKTKQTVRVQESNASLPRCLPNAQLVNSPSTSPGLTKQTVAVIPREDKDETLHVTQLNCTPSVNAKHESLLCSTAGGSNGKMERSIEGLNEGK